MGCLPSVAASNARGQAAATGGDDGCQGKDVGLSDPTLGEQLLEDGDVQALLDKKKRLVLIIHGSVYDVTDFAPTHPGGISVLSQNVGKEVGDVFDRIHRPSTKAQLATYCIGRLRSAGPRIAPTLVRKDREVTPGFVRATVLGTEMLLDDVVRITIAFPLGLQHSPGSYVRLKLPHPSGACDMSGNYTVASVTETSFMIISKRSLNHGVSSHVCSLQPGNEIEYEGPFAPSWVVEDDDELHKTPEEMRHVTFIAGGIGIVPIFAAVKNLLEKQIASATLVVSTRDLRRLVIRDEITELAKQYGSLRDDNGVASGESAPRLRKVLKLCCIFTRSSGEVNVPGADLISYARLDHKILSQFGSAVTVVICGPPDFTRAAKESAVKGGVCREERVIVL
ncbi:nitrate reductase [Trypanosoma brucei equiperdum]|uniref:Nitrate reductase n=1 Tax=Trypanosoma brucei equiperdum TaxID=630700 RepID=A0A3L6L663_9TRYP|nr:nitrate reductase [Trypanosoma brucei equiperdum]